jgi:hypothetical protein
MRRHQRFSPALILVIASVALGACANDPTGVRPVEGGPIAPTSKPLGKCLPGVHGDTIVAAIHSLSDARVAGRPEKLVACTNAG